MALAEEQRDEALSRVQMLTEKFDQLNSQNGASLPRGDLRGLSLQKLKGLQVSHNTFRYLHIIHTFRENNMTDVKRYDYGKTLSVTLNHTLRNVRGNLCRQS